MREEPLVLVGRVGASYRVEQHLVERRAGEPLERRLVEVREPRVAEVDVALVVEVRVGQRAVGGELLPVGEVVAVGDREVVAGVEVELRGAPGDDAEGRPLRAGPSWPTGSSSAGR